MTPAEIAHATYVTSSCVGTGMTSPSEAKNQTRGPRPSSVARRYFRIEYRDRGARVDTIQYGIGLHEQSHTAKKGLRWNSASPPRTMRERLARSRRGWRSAAPNR